MAGKPLIDPLDHVLDRLRCRGTRHGICRLALGIVFQAGDQRLGCRKTRLMGADLGKKLRHPGGGELRYRIRVS